MEDNDYIKTCECDGCGVRGPVVALHDRGVEVLALCKRCAPGNFESTARRGIDEWLGLPGRVLG